MATENFERNTPYHIAQAILTFDNALEMMFRLVLDTLPSTKLEKRDDYLPSLIDAFQSQVKDSQIKTASLKELHTIRNKIQHNGFIPDRTLVERSKSLTIETLEYLAVRVFGKDWKAISLSGLIQDPLVREKYQKAEEAYHAKDYKESVLNLMLAFEEARQSEQSRIYGSGMLLHMFNAAEAVEESKEDVKAVFSYTNLLSQEIEVLKLRLDYKAYMKYRSMFDEANPFAAPYLSEIEKEWELKPESKPKEGEWIVVGEIEKKKEIFIDEEVKKRVFKEVGMTKEDDLQEWLDFAINFVLESILRWEQLKR
jgi:hypothetical protein